MAHLFYNTLGNLAFCDPVTSTTSSCIVQTGWGLPNTGPFTNIQFGDYWSATDRPNTALAWRFNFGLGLQDLINNTNYYFAWAVHSGDVGASTVPVPAVAWLFGSGLLRLVGMARRKQAA